MLKVHAPGKMLNGPDGKPLSPTRFASCERACNSSEAVGGYRQIMSFEIVLRQPTLGAIVA